MVRAKSSLFSYDSLFNPISVRIYWQVKRIRNFLAYREKEWNLFSQLRDHARKSS